MTADDQARSEPGATSPAARSRGRKKSDEANALAGAALSSSLEELILDGTLRPGEKVEAGEVDSNVERIALERLRDDHRVERTQRSGTRALDPTPKVLSDDGCSREAQTLRLTEGGISENIKYYAEVVEQPPKYILRILGLPEGAPVLKQTIVDIKDDGPYRLTISWIAHELVENGPARGRIGDARPKAIADQLEAAGIKPTRTNVRTTSRLANLDDKKHLGVTLTSAVTFKKRTTYVGDRVVEFAAITTPANVVEYEETIDLTDDEPPAAASEADNNEPTD